MILNIFFEVFATHFSPENVFALSDFGRREAGVILFLDAAAYL